MNTDQSRRIARGEQAIVVVLKNIEAVVRAKINVHMGTCGIAAGARTVMTALIDEVERRGLRDVLLTSSGCAGLCSQEPMMTVEVAGQAPVKYVNLDAAKARDILEQHVIGGAIVRGCALGIGSEKTDV